MIQALVLSRDHRVFRGRLQEAPSLRDLSESLRRAGLTAGAPAGVDPPRFIIVVEGELPGEREGAVARNPEWVALAKALAGEEGERIWKLYCALLLGGWEPPSRQLDVFHFGAPGFMASKLAHLVAKGRKRLTAGWLEAHRRAGIAVPVPGGISIVTDGYGIPICCIRTNSVETLRFQDVTEEMAREEGEGDLTLEDWKQGHWDYWSTVEAPQTGLTFAEDSEIFVERFELLHVFGSGPRPIADRPVVTLVLGLTGSGKTTYASKLARERKVLHLAIDEWMKTLFWQDAPGQAGLDWALERCNRCEAQILQLLKQELQNGRGAVLDLGFSKSAERAAWKTRCEELGTAVEVVFLDVPAEERWRRVQARNAKLGVDDQSIQVDRATFDWMESYFEPLTADEKMTAKLIELPSHSLESPRSRE